MYATVTDCAHKTAPRAESNAYGYSVGTRDIKGGRLLLENAKPVSQETFETWTQREVPTPDDLVLAREAPVGQVGMIKAGHRICLGQRTVLIRCSAELDSNYLLYRILGPELQQWMEDHSEGSTVKHINVADVRKMPLPDLPSLTEQRAIASVLRAFDDLIDINTGLMSDLDAMYLTEWQRMFGRSVVEGEAFSLSELVSTQYGYTASATDVGEDPKFLRVMDINKRNWIDWGSVPHCPISARDLEKYRLRKGDIVVARMADPGKSAIVDDDSQDAVFASYLVRLKPINGVFSHYIYGLLKSPFYSQYAEGASGGSVQKNMNAKVITGVQVGTPSLVAVEAFDALGTEIRAGLNQLQAEVNELSRTRDVLLPLLLSGKVAPNSAAKLLEAV
ncbi:restriction endonuclease subunit S [Arthrobacter sp. SO3]|uniref:restriction endonuclease subunit S n=1 Tax=Arthrobacter sp. SO3 TaxID=1897057 RepID=UPI001CFF74E3|nr:restriction endonuclease subunit S [Arthrobacter sp. SO3]